MQFNPFGHIETKNFIHHSLGQRFKDAWKALGLGNPFDFEKIKQKLAPNLHPQLDLQSGFLLYGTLDTYILSQ